MATFVSLDVFRPEINQYCPGAPAILIRTHVLKAAIRFCERTMILKKDPSTFCLDEEEHTYTLKYSSDRYRAINIEDITLGTGSTAWKVSVTTEHELDSSIRNWRQHTNTKPSNCYLTEDLNRIRFYPAASEDTDDEINLTTAVTYKRDQTEIDEFLYEKWEDVIQAGAIATLLGIQGSSWYDRGQSETFGRAWSRGIRRARKIVTAGTGDQPGRVTPQSFITQGNGAAVNRQGNYWDR